MWFLLPLLVAVAPAIIQGVAAQASTVTVVQTFTRIHTTIIYASQFAAAGSPANLATCAATESLEGTPASCVLSTIHTTSYGTQTVTAVVTSDSSTTTLSETTDIYTSFEPSLSCVNGSASLASTIVASTITQSVYPIPAGSISTLSDLPTSSSSFLNASSTYPPPPVGWQSQPPFPCNKSTTVVVITVTASTTEANNASMTSNSSISTIQTSMPANSSTSGSYTPANYTASPFLSSAGRAVRLPSFIGVIARFLSLGNLAMATSAKTDTSQDHIMSVNSQLEGQFSSYLSPFNPGRPPYIIAEKRLDRFSLPSGNPLPAVEPTTASLPLHPPPSEPTLTILTTTSSVIPPTETTCETLKNSSSLTQAPGTFTPWWSTILNVTTTDTISVPTTVSVTINQPRSNESMAETTTIYLTEPNTISVTKTLEAVTTSTYTTDSITTETVSTPPFSGPAMTAVTTTSAGANAGAGVELVGYMLAAEVLGLLFMLWMLFG